MGIHAVKFQWVGFLTGVALLAGCRGATTDPTPDAFAYLPADTSILLVGNVSSFVDTPAFTQIEEEVLETEGIGDLLREADVTLGEAVDTLYIGLSGAMDAQLDSARQGMTAIVRTKLPDTFLDDLMGRSTHSFIREMVGDSPVWVLRADDEPLAIAALAKGHLGFGLYDPVREMLLRSQGKSPGLTRESELIASAGTLDMAASLWGVAHLDDASSEQVRGNPMTAGLASIRALTWAAYTDETSALTVDVNAICGSADEAQQVQSYVETLLGLAAMGQKEDSPLTAVLNALTTSTTANRTSIHVVVPPALLRTWLEEVGETAPRSPTRP